MDIRRQMRLAWLVVAFLAAGMALDGETAAAQWATGQVVPSCGGQALIPGSPYPFTIDTTGRPCAAGPSNQFSEIVPNNTTAVVIKASAGRVFSAKAFNNSATIAYVKLYDATSTTCGAGTPVARFMIPASSGFIYSVPGGTPFANGIRMCVTGGIADNDTTAPAAATYLVNLDYQ